MDKIAIVTDSMANISRELRKRYDVRIVPIPVVFGQQVFRDGVDITPAEFCRRLREEKTLPTTTTPSVGEFLKLYTELSQAAEAIVSIHVSGEVSTTVEMAREASRMLPTIPIQVIDSRPVIMSQGFIVLEAARAAAAGASLSQVVERAKALIPKVDLFATLDTFAASQAVHHHSLIMLGFLLPPTLAGWDGVISRPEGLALAALYLSYLAWLFRGRAPGRSGVIKAVFALD